MTMTTDEIPERVRQRADFLAQDLGDGSVIEIHYLADPLGRWQIAGESTSGDRVYIYLADDEWQEVKS